MGHPAPSTKAGARVKELQRIDAENQRLLKRLQSEPSWDHDRRRWQLGEIMVSW